MICDGYNLTVDLDGIVIIYRPLRRQRRSELSAFIRSLTSEAAALHSYCQAFIPQIVMCSVSSDELEEIIQQKPELHLRFANLLLNPDWDESEDANNLKNGMQIGLGQYKHLNHVTCEQCRYWWYDPIDGTVSKRQGQPLKRPEGMPLLCETQVGCPKGHWKNPKGSVLLSEKNKKAINHYHECLAVGSFPDDDIVRHNALIISRHLKGINAQ